MDQDHPRARLVCLLPHLRTRGARVRRNMEARRLQRDPSKLTSPPPATNNHATVTATCRPGGGVSPASALTTAFGAKQSRLRRDA
jgi:hypothetical protein